MGFILKLRGCTQYFVSYERGIHLLLFCRATLQARRKKGPKSVPGQKRVHCGSFFSELKGLTQRLHRIHEGHLPETDKQLGSSMMCFMLQHLCLMVNSSYFSSSCKAAVKVAALLLMQFTISTDVVI